MDNREADNNYHPPTCTCHDCVQRRLKQAGYVSRRTENRSAVRPPKIRRREEGGRGRFSWGKLLINLLIVSSLIGLGIMGYYAFTHRVPPSMGTIGFLIFVVLFICLVSVTNSRSYKYRTPSFKLVFWPLVGIILVATFAGLQPLSDYKDATFTKIGKWWASPPAFTVNMTATKITTPAPATQPTSQPDTITGWMGTARQALFPNDQEIQSDAFKLINDARAKAGLIPLIENPTLTALAREHSLEMDKTKVLSHNGFDSRMARSGYSYVGENVAEGYQSAASLVDGWLSSPGHKANIVNPRFRYSGLAYVNGWAVQLFAGY